MKRDRGASGNEWAEAYESKRAEARESKNKKNLIKEQLQSWPDVISGLNLNKANGELTDNVGNYFDCVKLGQTIEEVKTSIKDMEYYDE